MSILHYDLTPLDTLKDNRIDIERIYCFDWDAFDDEQWGYLWEIFRLLPQSRKCESKSGPHWYSDHEDIENGYLTASVESPGLQVYGTLPIEAWEEWDLEFQARAEGLPVRKLELPKV